MLNWVKDKFGKNNESAEQIAFARDEYLKDYVSELPVSQPLICAHEIASTYESLMSWSLQDTRRRAVVQQLDEHAQRHLRVAWHMLFPKTDEAGINEPCWAALSRYYQAMADLCARLTAIPATEDERRELTTTANLALYAMSRQDLLQRLRQRPPDAGFWRRLFDLYRKCEGAKLSHRKVEQTGYLRGSTGGRLFARIVAFEAGPLESFSPMQSHVHFHLVARFEEELSLATSPAASHVFFIDLADAAGPRRWRADSKLATTCRFLDVARVHARIQILLRDSTRERNLPDWMAETECGIAAYMRLLNHLIKAWAAAAPNRRHTRTAAQADFLVCHEFGQVRRMVAAAEYARNEARRDEMRYVGSELYDPKRFDEVHFGTVETPAGSHHARHARKPRTALEILAKLETAGDKGLMDLWKVEDHSERGFGALPVTTARWARVSAILAFRQPTRARWNIGLLRRVTANAAGRQLLGIEVYRGEAAVAKVNLLSERDAEINRDQHAADETAVDAIMLISAEKQLILPRAKFVANAAAVMHYGGNQTRIRLGDALEVGEDYVVCPFGVWVAVAA